MILRTVGLLLLLGLGLGNASEKTLGDVVKERPYPEYGTWWVIGNDFARFMSEAIVSEWSALPGNTGELGEVESFVSEYTNTVYGREPSTNLVRRFVGRDFSEPLQSGEFDALSYAFYRSAFELMERPDSRFEHPLEQERRSFTQRVGRKFFARVRERLDLELPPSVGDAPSFEMLKKSIDRVTAFLKEQGYFRDHAAFRFDIELAREGRRIVQTDSDFLQRVNSGATGYALFEMGYPVILPSAVYLFHTLGEAQHHSSRTIEELFDRIGYEAGETADFDPIGYPSDMVVEVWEIRARR
jgi:hypothetical protein